MLLTFLLTFFVDSLSNPLFIVTISVPKRRMKMIWVDCQVIMLCAPSHNFFRNFMAKNFVDSIIIVTFAESYPYWKLQLGEGGMDIYT